MRISDMFVDKIDRPINGVIKVDQSDMEVIEQEVREYVITSELKERFIEFFEKYSQTINQPTADIGVWISGFFGSGKSHFLKMLSYILENREIDGKYTVDYFKDKLKDDPNTFELIEQSTRGQTDTILFNIDIESKKKDNQAIVRVFKKMFYNYLGYYGENDKVARLEKELDSNGKLEDFRKLIENKTGREWTKARRTLNIKEDIVVSALMEVLGWSEEASRNWFNAEKEEDTSIADLVEDIKEYVDSKPDDFRLVFMIDEAGQYIGTDTGLLLNLQSIVERLGSECLGKVWVMATGQEAIDEIIKVRDDEFSRIQARFKIRLSLTSASADEVIQKRLLSKTDSAKELLYDVYDKNHAIMKNLFAFSESIKDITGYSSSEEYISHFPFVPYQFIIMPKIFGEIRKHGNAGKHLSGGERSLLSGFQEAAIAVKDKDEFAVVPFYMFYDTVHSFLDGSIRRVIERAERASLDSSKGLEPFDINVLKLLYMIRYVDDIKPNIDNITILMANDIRVEKIGFKEEIKASLDRLVSQNYVGRTNDRYQFLTDEEQDIQREIANTLVETSAVQDEIGNTIFSGIYTNKKFNYGKNDYQFNQMVDNINKGSFNSKLTLQFLTFAFSDYEKNQLSLMTNSSERVIFVLGDNSYYEIFEKYLKIRRYVSKTNTTNKPDSIKDIIQRYQREASNLEKEATAQLVKAIEEAQVYVDKEIVNIATKDPKEKIDQALTMLASSVYNKLDLINFNASTNEDIQDVLSGKAHDGVIEEVINNRDAALEIEQYLDIQDAKSLSTNMEEIYTRYSDVPYGWREIDIAYAVAILIYEQKVTIKHNGQTIQPNDARLVNMLRDKSLRIKTEISKRNAIKPHKIRETKEFLREYFDAMSIPDDEDGLIKYIKESFEEELNHNKKLLTNYRLNENREEIYPGKKILNDSNSLIEELLHSSKDNNSFIDKLLELQYDLEDNKEELEKVENFFNSQVAIFDSAINLEKELRDDIEYIREYEEINEPLKKIRLITKVEGVGEFDYSKIYELNALMQDVTEGHNNILNSERDIFENEVRNCMAEVKQAGDRKNPNMKNIMEESDRYFIGMLERAKAAKTKTLISSMYGQISSKRDHYKNRLEDIKKSIERANNPSTEKEVEKPKKPETIVSERRLKKSTIKKQMLLSNSRIESQEDIEEYINLVSEEIRSRLEKELKDNDVIIID